MCHFEESLRGNKLLKKSEGIHQNVKHICTAINGNNVFASVAFIRLHDHQSCNHSQSHDFFILEDAVL